jgi:large subunit ribosomal protein L18
VSEVKRRNQTRKRRQLRVRDVDQKGHMPRVAVFRSLSEIYAQLIDDNEGKTLASASSLTLKKASGDKKEVAFSVGKELARKALEKGVQQACFDRGRFLYHGRVKSLADGLREGGLNI